MIRVLIGNGGHARSCRDVMGFGSGALHYLADEAGGDDLWLGTFAKLHDLADAEFHLAIGPSRARTALAKDLIESSVDWFSAVSPLAVIRSEMIGKGVFVGHSAHLGPGSSVGDLAIINTGAIVEHDCRIGVGAFVGPGAILCGGVTVGDYAMVGAGAIVVPKITIEAGARVPAGATLR